MGGLGVFEAALAAEKIPKTGPIKQMQERLINQMNKLEALISLNMVGDIGTIRLNKLLQFFGKPENILKAASEKLMAVSGIGRNTGDKIHSLKKED